MNTVYGNFRLKIDLPIDDKTGDIAREIIDKRLALAEHILNEVMGIEMSFEWEEID